MSKSIYDRPIAFALLAAGVILIGTLVTTFVPMLFDEMHPKLENLQTPTALELAGRDIYQREGCVNCHTQTVRPLKSEVMRYGEFSKAGEFAYDRPFLWGSKRTGPDLARIGKKYPDQWHYMHFDDARSVAKGSNMPTYGWMKDYPVNAKATKSHMEALSFPYTDDEIEALADKNDLDALVAYLQSLGHAIRPTQAEEVQTTTLALEAPLPTDDASINKGATIFAEQCSMCHGEKGEGGIAPAISDNVWLGTAGAFSDAAIVTVIAKGTTEGMMLEGRTATGGMPGFETALSKKELSELAAFIKSIAEPVATPAVKKEYSAEAIAKGKTVYNSKCGGCHGSEAQGLVGPNLKDNQWLYVVRDISDENIALIISEGTSAGKVIDGRTAKGGMPPFGAFTSKEDIEAAVAYLRSIAE
ncbi:cbb3-type cytochrome c oxidase subunit II [Nitrospirota bacterium]